MKRVILSSVIMSVLLFADYVEKAEYNGRYSNVVSIADVNHNGYLEIYEPCFLSNPDSQIIIIREYDHQFNLINATHLDFYGLVWDIGDIDQNGLMDIVVQTGDPGMGGNGYLEIFEQRRPDGFPDSLIAKVTLPERKVYYYAKYGDLDQDGKMEVIMSPNHFYGGGLRIYEWDNGGLNLIFNWEAEQTGEKAIGDFNQNGKLEVIITGPSYSTGLEQNNNLNEPVYGLSEYSERPSVYCGIYIFECQSDNTYELIDSINYPHEIAIMGSVKNFDFNGDGRPEFLTAFSTHDIGYRFLVWKYENGYQVWYDMGESTGYIGLTASTAGDFDQDGKDEFLATIQPWWIRVYDWQSTGPIWQVMTADEGLGLYNADFDHDKWPEIYITTFRPNTGHAEFWKYEPTGIGEINSPSDEKNQLKVTPSVGKIFKIEGLPINQEILIYNHLGQLVERVRVGLANLGHLPGGIYFFKTKTGEIQKIIITK